MNKESLYEYGKSIFDLFNIPVMIYHKNSGKIDKAYIVDNRFVESMINNSSITRRYMGKNMFDDNHIVSYYISDDQIAFGNVIVSKSEYNLYIGPCLLAEPTEKLMRSMLSRSNSPFKDHQDKYYDSLFSYIKQLPKFTLERFLWLLSFTNNYVNQSIIDKKDFYQTSINKNKIHLNDVNNNTKRDNDFFDYQTYQTYLNEISTLILNSNKKQIENYWSMNSTYFFKLINSFKNNSDTLRYYKNNFIQFISYFSSILISNGISENQCFKLINDLSNKVENCIVVQQIESLYYDAIISFVDLTNKHKNNITDNALINKAINYIHDNINKPLSSTDIARHLGISRGYLSSLFNSLLNTTINDYINKERIEVAKSLLINTSNNIIDISNYLSYSSQSYFQNIFKKYTGLTPLQFRNTQNKK